MRIGEGTSSSTAAGLAQSSAGTPSVGSVDSNAANVKGADAPETEGPSPFQQVLRGLGHEVDQGERVMRKATSAGGQDLGPSELIALQAGVYKYSEAVDLSSKIIDRATNGIKTVIQGQ
ncbi:MAG: hypothetical protein FWD73_10530 [Polyangiaceae bacterium]|nr:hypothetical protein [Polyangiaceae bacterium]